MIDTDKYKIRDDVVWVWNENLDDNYDMINNSPKPSGWVLWEYKECPAEKGGYTLMDGRGSDKTYEPWFQVLPALEFECKIDEKMFAIMDLPLIIQEVKRLQIYKKAWDKLYEHHNDETELGWEMQELMDKTMKEEDE